MPLSDAADGGAATLGAGWLGGGVRPTLKVIFQGFIEPVGLCTKKDALLVQRVPRAGYGVSSLRTSAHRGTPQPADASGRSPGVQFHPEVTPAIMEDWVRVDRHELDGGGVDPDALLQETYDRAESAHATSRRLRDTSPERVAKLGRRRT